MTGIGESLPLLDAADVPENARREYLDLDVESACEYCEYGALCGKAWERLS